MGNKTVPEKVEEIVEEAFRRLQKVEDSRHDWTELRDALTAIDGGDLYMAYMNWQDRKWTEHE